MLKKIRIEELTIGMVVEKMDRSWLEHPFLTGRKKITSQDHIERLREYNIIDLYINTDMGLDIVNDPDDPPSAGKTPAPRIEFVPEPPPVSTGPFAGLPRNLSAPLEEPVPFEREIEAAKVVHKEAHAVVSDVLHDVRLGRNIEGGRTEAVVGNMVDSIFRNMDALSSLGRIKGYDEYTFVHSVNVCVLSLTLGRHLGLDREEMLGLGVGGLLHDAGKMKVPPEILNKPGKLTDAEFAEMKMHAAYSVEVLDQAGGITEEARMVALQHHERFLGTGYPGGLKGEEIHRCAQIAAIADVYDAITSNRVYHTGMAPHEGVRKIYEWGKRDFNPVFLQRFIQCLGIYPAGTTVELDSGEIGVVTSVNHEKVLRPHVLLLYRKAGVHLPAPLEVDLDEPLSPGSAKFRRTVARPVDPANFGIDIDLYLPKAAP